VGSYSPQLSQAAAFYQEIKAAHPDATISFTGHSLGGGLAALMGVFFDKEAVTFDPAPFRNAASLANMAVLTIDLAVRGFFDSDLVSFFNIGGFVRGESNISQYAVAGEALSYFALNLLKIGNAPTIIGQGSENTSVFDLHSQALLIALAQSCTLRTTSFELPFLVPDLFDENLFAFDTDSEDVRDLLSHLVRYEFGVPGQLNTKQLLLTHFSDDMSKLGAYSGQYDDILRPLSHLGMQHYYQTLGTFQREFFTSVLGGIQFDLTRPLGDQVTALADIKGYSEFLEGIRDRIQLEALADVDAFLTEAARITVALADSIEAWAPDDDTPDFMLAGESGGMLSGNGGDDLLVGGNSSDSLYGGDGQDYLFGGNGNDSLYGGEDGDYLDGGVGVNYLYGGNGFDTYVFSTDTSNIGTYNIIFDEDGFGELNFLDINSPLQSLESKGPNHWESTDGSIRINRFSSGVESYSLDIQFLDGSHSPIRVRDFENGDLGVTLPGFEADSVPEVVTTNVINGTSDDDNLSGTAANDAIETFAGNDSVDGEDGDDYISLGDGDDMLFANAADDYNTILNSDNVTPGTDNDWLNADIGDDVIGGGSGDDTITERDDDDQDDGASIFSRAA
jgi:hypothetical protein